MAMGYAQVPLALRVQGLTAAQKEVLVFLTDAANPAVQRRGVAVGRFACFHSQGQVADALDRDRKTVGRAFADLERRGLIERTAAYTARGEAGVGRDADTVAVVLEAMAAHSTMSLEQLGAFCEANLPRGYVWGRYGHECGPYCPGVRSGQPTGAEAGSPSSEGARVAPSDNPEGGQFSARGVPPECPNPWDILGGGWGQKAPAEQGTEQGSEPGTPFYERDGVPRSASTRGSAPGEPKVSHLDADLGPGWRNSPEKAQLLDRIQQVARGERDVDDLANLLEHYIGEGVALALHGDGVTGYHYSPPTKATSRYEAGVWLSKFYNFVRRFEDPEYEYPEELPDTAEGKGWRRER